MHLRLFERRPSISSYYEEEIYRKIGNKHYKPQLWLSPPKFNKILFMLGDIKIE